MRADNAAEGESDNSGILACVVVGDEGELPRQDEPERAESIENYSPSSTARVSPDDIEENQLFQPIPGGPIIQHLPDIIPARRPRGMCVILCVLCLVKVFSDPCCYRYCPPQQPIGDVCAHATPRYGYYITILPWRRLCIELWRRDIRAA